MDFKVINRDTISSRHGNAKTRDEYKLLAEVAKLGVDCVEVDQDGQDAKCVVNRLNYINSTYFNRAFSIIRRGEKVYVARGNKE